MKYGRTQTGNDRRGTSMSKHWDRVRRYAKHRNISLTDARFEMWIQTKPNRKGVVCSKCGLDEAQLGKAVCK